MRKIGPIRHAAMCGGERHSVAVYFVLRELSARRHAVAPFAEAVIFAAMSQATAGERNRGAMKTGRLACG
jgi:hypothetical protein